MKSKLLMSVLVIALAVAVIGGATMAWFTDEDASDPVNFTAGTLLVDLDVSDIVSETANINNLNPGDEFEWDVTVKNIGTKNFKYGIYVCWKDTIGQENDSLPEGQQDLLKQKVYGTNPLSEVMEFTVYDGDNVLYEGKLPENGPIGAYITDPDDDEDKFAPNAEQTFRIEAKLPQDADNKYQGGKMEIVFGVKAWQATNGAPAPTLDEVVCPFDLEFEVKPGPGVGQNDFNKEKNRPYIDYETDGNKITINFVNPTSYSFSWDYQVDGKPTGTPDSWTGQTIGEGPLAGQDFGLRYSKVTLNGQGNHEITVSAMNEVRVRLARGAEQNWYFDWIVFGPKDTP